MRSLNRYKTRFGLLSLITVFLVVPLSAFAETHEVMVLDPSNFSPSNLTIEVGDTVRWINPAGGSLHDVTADDFSFASVTASSFTFERTFNSIAEILYHCKVHSRAASAGGTNQNGRINVIDSAAATSDVSIEAFAVVDGAFEAGEDIRVKATLTNTSVEDTGMFNLNIYLSVDADITSSDTLLEAINISNVAAGSSKDIDESINLTADLVAGDYFIGAISQLDDSDSSNNTNVDETTIYVFTEFDINAGLNDAWFNRDTTGQGFFITIFPDLGFASLAWFTYDTELPTEDATANLGDPGHRWLTAVGPFSGDSAEMNISITTGGLFDTIPDEALPSFDDGTIILKFNNCNEGTVSYDITSIGQQGVVPITRVAGDNIALCDALLREMQQAPQ